jgi:hypothetical protein
MNREDESPTDPTFEPDAPEARERLDEIERRLKAARPRPPRLDVAALQRLARQAAVDTPVESPTAVAIRRRPPGGGRRPYRRIAIISGSWACGAIAGALVMFILTSRAAPSADATNDMARHEAAPPASATRDRNTAPDADEKVDRRDGPPPVEKVETLDADAAALAMILDPFGSEDSACWPEGPALWAGMHLGQYSGDWSKFAGRAADAAGKPREDDEGWRSEAPKGRKPYPDPAPSITRERLMRELLRETPGVLL